MTSDGYVELPGNTYVAEDGGFSREAAESLAKSLEDASMVTRYAFDHSSGDIIKLRGKYKEILSGFVDASGSYHPPGAVFTTHEDARLGAVAYFASLRDFHESAEATAKSVISKLEAPHDPLHRS
jgi:hypothetical protein